MDDNTRQLLVALLTGLFGLLTGVGVAALGFRHARELDRARWEREDAHRWSIDRRQLYGRFIVEVESWQNVVSMQLDIALGDREGEPPKRSDLRVYYAAYAELRIMGSRRVRAAIAELQNRLTVLEAFGTHKIEPKDADLVRSLSDELGPLRGEMLAAFHEDLGIEPDPTEPQSNAEPPSPPV